jgi:hypothetical protein
MATFVKFHQFVEDLGNGVHNLDSDSIKVYLTNAAPNAATHAVKADIAEITNENGYTAPIDLTATYSQTSGTGNLVLTDQTVTASGGTIGPFRYAVVYNDTPTSPADPLIGYVDYGSAITPASGETFNIDFASPTATVV